MRTYEYINSGWRFSKVGGLPEGRQTDPKGTTAAQDATAGR